MLLEAQISVPTESISAPKLPKKTSVPPADLFHISRINQPWHDALGKFPCPQRGLSWPFELEIRLESILVWTWVLINIGLNVSQPIPRLILPSVLLRGRHPALQRDCIRRFVVTGHSQGGQLIIWVANMTIFTLRSQYSWFLVAFCSNRDESLPVDHQFYLGLDYYRNRQCGFNWIVACTPNFYQLRRGLLFPDSYRRVLERSKFNWRSESINAKSGWTSSISIFRRCSFPLSFQRFPKTPSPNFFLV